MSGGSIQRRLLVWLLAVLLAGAAGTAIVVYVLSRDEANTLFDYQLRQVAMSLPTQAFGPLTRPHSGLPGEEDGVVVQIWDLNGNRLYRSHPDAVLPAQVALGFSTVATSSGDWRTYSALFNDDVIQVAQPMRIRRELAAAVALRTVIPLIVLMPIIALLVWLTVGHGLRPIRALARDVGQRNPNALDEIPKTDLPDEVQPLVGAVNLLLRRLAAALDAQRAFVADAAHELRTPLTALQLQLQLATRANAEADRELALDQLRSGFLRLNHLVEQLLALARSEHDVHGKATSRVDLVELAQDVVAQANVMALQRHIDLGVDAVAPHAWVLGDRESLRTLIQNIVTNAIKYSPEEGRIDVALTVTERNVVLTVSDAGPGIPPAERERVFDRFYRTGDGAIAGSGLGLAIVKSIANRHDATVTLADASPDGGLRVEVVFVADSAHTP